MPHTKILHFITDTDIGGTELMLVRLVPHLKKTFDTRVVSALPRGPIGLLLEERGVPVTYLSLRHWFDIGILFRFARVVRDFQPDILVTHLIHPDIFGRIFGRLFGIKTIVCSQQGSLLQWEFLRTVDRLTARLVDLYIVQTDIAKEELANRLRLPLDRFVVIPNSVVPHGLIVDKEAMSQELSVPARDVKIVCVSRLRRRKGHEHLLEAFNTLFLLHNNISLILVGDGEREDALRAQITAYPSRHKIFFLGNRHDVDRLLAFSDIFVLPTLAEGMSNAILEAMAAGLPCVVSDIPVNRALITPGQNGLFFKAGDSHDLAATLAKLITNSTLQQRLANQARADVRRLFDPLAIGEQWVQVLAKLTS